MKIGERKPGHRVFPGADGVLRLPEGGYGNENGVWKARPPAHHMGDLTGHKVVEHEDGTITVRPSILIDAPPHENWHGYLERGVWRRIP